LYPKHSKKIIFITKIIAKILKKKNFFLPEPLKKVGPPRVELLGVGAPHEGIATHRKDVRLDPDPVAVAEPSQFPDLGTLRGGQLTRRRAKKKE
jgi:hypothetical protein